MEAGRPGRRLQGETRVLATFVIGLREGIEAALIIGIIAAFLRRNGRSDLLRPVAAGVAVAVGICLAVAVGLQLLSASLEVGQQEALEVIVGIAAIGMVSYMLVWMRRNASAMKGRLEGATAQALAQGTAGALVAMAFLAVLREGFETAVFLLAAFNAAESPLGAGGGALLGILVAVGVGGAIYRGGARLDLRRFFRLTALVLVLVAAGLVASSIHAAQEVGWLTLGGQPVANLDLLADPNTPLAAMLTGVLGVRAEPTLAEALGWLVYLVPMAAYVLRPSRPGRPLEPPVSRVSAGTPA
jgi:high-affinity iron transporter